MTTPIEQAGYLVQVEERAAAAEPRPKVWASRRGEREPMGTLRECQALWEAARRASGTERDRIIDRLLRLL